jgi:predicted acyl esterase
MPDGSAEVISFGRLALSHRKTAVPPYLGLGLPWHSGLAKDVSPLNPGALAQLDFDLTPVSRVVSAGSSLRVVITGADPRQRNLAEIKQTPPPIFSVLLGGKIGSRIELPTQK